MSKPLSVVLDVTILVLVLPVIHLGASPIASAVGLTAIIAWATAAARASDTVLALPQAMTLADERTCRA